MAIDRKLKSDAIATARHAENSFLQKCYLAPRLIKSVIEFK